MANFVFFGEECEMEINQWMTNSKFIYNENVKATGQNFRMYKNIKPLKKNS